MPKLTIVARNGTSRLIESAGSTSVMRIIRDSGFEELQALCGGSCSCATCHVYVNSGFEDKLPAMSADEDDLLDSSSHRTASSRLSCQITFGESLDGLQVTIAPED